MPHSKREIEFMKNYMAHVLVLNFHGESVFLSQTSLQPLEDTKKDILMLHSKREIELMKNDLAHGLLEVWEVVFDLIFAFLVKN